MFAKIIQGKETESQSEILLDCDQVILNSKSRRTIKEEREATDDFVFVDIVHNNNYETFHLPKSSSELYIMNNDGKTIDYYKWGLG